MKENFTAKQKEVVARKMGYDGPMQMFDEFLMSRPSDAQRYASITSKFAENMARGGVVGYAQGGAVAAPQKKASYIIKQYMRANGVDPTKRLNAIYRLVKLGDAILLQENQSVLELRKITPGVLYCHLYSLDKPMTLVKSLTKFIQKIKQSDIKVLYGMADNPQIIALIKSLGLPVVASDRPEFNWRAVL
jgi:hypothetical protein